MKEQDYATTTKNLYKSIRMSQFYESVGAPIFIAADHLTENKAARGGAASATFYSQGRQKHSANTTGGLFIWAGDDDARYLEANVVLDSAR